MKVYIFINFVSIKFFIICIHLIIFFIAVILNGHLTEALRRMREESSENNVDKLVYLLKIYIFLSVIIILMIFFLDVLLPTF
jgi:hypothetical protein